MFILTLKYPLAKPPTIDVLDGEPSPIYFIDGEIMTHCLVSPNSFLVEAISKDIMQQLEAVNIKTPIHSFNL